MLKSLNGLSQVGATGKGFPWVPYGVLAEPWQGLAGL
jgi:hypothetical protein